MEVPAISACKLGSKSETLGYQGAHYLGNDFIYPLSMILGFWGAHYSNGSTDYISSKPGSKSGTPGYQGAQLTH
jgi:hypothetical protein